MKKALSKIFRYIVGPEHGFYGEGNSQWYYTLALMISLTLIWWLEPQLTIAFTILAILHYMTIVVYGVYDFDEADDLYSYSCLGVNLIILLVAALISLQWTVICAVIAVSTFFLPQEPFSNDETSEQQFQKKSLICNTVLLSIFIILTFLLPIQIGLKFILLTATLLIHPIIDYFAGEGVDVTQIAYRIRDSIIDLFKTNKKK